MTRTWRDGTDSRRRSCDRPAARRSAPIRRPRAGSARRPVPRRPQRPRPGRRGEPTAITVPVMNTGEGPTRSSSTWLTCRPAGRRLRAPQTLAAGGGSTAMLQLRPAPGAALGVYTIQCAARARANTSVTSSASFQVEVIDVTPPDVQLSLSPGLLRPSNHKLAAIAATADGDRRLRPESLRSSSPSVTSSEPDDGLGDGDTAGDIRGRPPRHGRSLVRAPCRAQRQRHGSRVHRRVQATDASGNAATEPPPCSCRRGKTRVAESVSPHPGGNGRSS